MRYTSILLLALVMTAAFISIAISATQIAKPMTTPEAINVEATQVTVKVVDVNIADHTIRLQMPNGRVRSFKVSKDVKNLGMLKKGDTIRSTLLDSIAVYIEKAGGRPISSETETVMLSPRGAMPGVIVADTIRTSGKIQHIDMQNHAVTVSGPRGISRTFKIAGNVKNLNSLKVGDDIILRYTQALAIDVRKATK